eukprot:CAMPEP_0194308842 /NCGR_PEP_ID=MMETSP0171-20130528/5797_1 /TAXON_ID=218684 /ORGANISM="Corethron pennatum, Strain L29A3" /LENGTH=92 /DNA_ID=CAMNT_0039061669 /DNA_START=18 /DNA_END=297 /DNA_ORIENTATION=-
MTEGFGALREISLDLGARHRMHGDVVGVARGSLIAARAGGEGVVAGGESDGGGAGATGRAEGGVQRMRVGAGGRERKGAGSSEDVRRGGRLG